MARIYAGILGCLALLTTVARALIHGGSLVEALWVGCGWMAAFAVVGGIAGKIAERTVEDSVAGRLLAEMSAAEAVEGASSAAKGSVE